MELLLNLCWCGLVLIALLLARRKEFSPERSRALLALACVAFLIFPAISISDDLHVTDVPFEEANKRTVKIAAALASVQALPAPVALTAAPQMQICGTVSQPVGQLCESAPLGIAAGRAPPQVHA